MKMDDMVTWLEKRGFKVKKTYISSIKSYDFIIERDDHKLARYFQYPHQNRAGADAVQRQFLTKMVEDFERIHPKKAETTGLVVEGSKREWTDPASGKTFSYDWGIDTSKAKEYTAEYKDRYYLTGRHNGKSMTIAQIINEMLDNKENNMNNIKWRVESITADQSINAYPVIRMDVRGIMTGPIGNVGNFNYIASRLEAAMNRTDISKPTMPTIKNVIFSPPATIVFWTDNTKTVVKCQENDIYDPEKGLAMAYMKKSMGNKGNYFNEVKKWTEKYERECILERIKEIDEWHSKENASVFAKIYYALMSGATKSPCEVIAEEGLADEFEKAVNEVMNENAE